MRYTLILLATIITSCSPLTESKPKRNVRSFVEEHIHSSVTINIDDVERIDISDPDTIISDVAVGVCANNLSMSRESYYAGRISRDSMDASSFRLQRAILDYQYAVTVEATPQLMKKYGSRLLYTATIVMKSGKTIEAKIVMDNDNETPYDFLHTILDRVENYRIGL